MLDAWCLPHACFADDGQTRMLSCLSLLREVGTGIEFRHEQFQAIMVDRMR
jgi:hypothetical protein